MDISREHKLRVATATEIPAIWQVRHAVTENVLTPGKITDEDVRREIEETGRGWVVEVDGVVRAFAIGNGRTGNVWAIFVHPDAQGRGYGSLLHDEMIGWFATQPVAWLWLTTGTDTRARAFYEKHGWRLIGPTGTEEVRYERENRAAAPARRAGDGGDRVDSESEEETMRSIVLSLCFVALVVAGLVPAGAQEWAIEKLEASPRHHEWVEVPAGEGRTVRSFVAYPEAPGKTLAVIVIHENRGLTDWVRLFADQVAEAGYLAIAPDLLSGFDAGHADTGAFENSDAAREAIYALDADRVTADLLAVQKHVAGLPAASGKTVVAGFCWGGSQSFRFATSSPDLSAALVFYGTGPDDEAGIAAIAAPVYGFYGENDERVNATIPASKESMAKHGKTYEVEIYDGAGHAFMRQADDPEGSPEAKKAKEAAWARMKEILSGIE